MDVPGTWKTLGLEVEGFPLPCKAGYRHHQTTKRSGHRDPLLTSSLSPIHQWNCNAKASNSNRSGFEAEATPLRVEGLLAFDESSVKKYQLSLFECYCF